MSNIIVIGNGTIGGAIASQLEKIHELTCLDSKTKDYSILVDSTVIIIAVKPQQFTALANQIKHYTKNKVVISVMAGVSISKISNQLGSKRIIRTMPNIGICAGQSLTAALASSSTTLEDKRLITDIMNHWGKTIWLKQESQFDSFTAIAGSGPAYFFELANQLEQNALRNGFSMGEARAIANQTLRASSMQLSNTESAKAKVSIIASKGGTTEKAIESLKRDNFSKIITNAVEAAAERSKQLSL